MKRTSSKPKPQTKAGNRVPKINPPKPAPMGGHAEGYAGPAGNNGPMPRRWSPK